MEKSKESYVVLRSYKHGDVSVLLPFYTEFSSVPDHLLENTL